jgi:hypothetical protein
MYRVRITAHHDHFLDWDKPLSEQPRVLSAIEGLWKRMGEPPEDWRGMTAAQAYDRLAKHVGGDGASQELHKAGIPGIKYLDQGSRDIPARVEERNGRFAIVDDGGHLLGKHGVFDDEQEAKAYLASLPPRTRNFVVFDDKHIEITHKNGEPVKREDLVAEHQMRRAKEKGLRGRAAADPAPGRSMNTSPARAD